MAHRKKISLTLSQIKLFPCGLYKLCTVISQNYSAALLKYML